LKLSEATTVPCACARGTAIKTKTSNNSFRVGGSTVRGNLLLPPHFVDDEFEISA